MKTKVIITNTLCLLLLLPLAESRQEGAKGGEAGAAPPIAIRPNDVDLGHGYVRRDGAIHFIGGSVTGTGANATRIDTPSTRVLRGFRNAKYGPFETAEGLDVASFEPLSEEYARDESHVYYKVISPGVFLVVQVPEADPASFEPLAFPLARDKNHVWYHNEIQPGVDPATIELVDGGRVYKDKDSVHYAYTKMADADPTSFRHLGSGYYADKNTIYWCTDPIPGADGDSFEVLGDSFVAKDRDRVYRSGQPLSGIDAASVELILHDPSGFQFFSDKNGIHLNTMTFPRSTPGEVELIDELAVKSGDLVHLVSLHHFTPVTVFRENGKLMAEAPVYDPEKQEILGAMTAEVTSDGLDSVRISPLPGSSITPSVPNWQLAAFNRPDLVDRMKQAGKLLGFLAIAGGIDPSTAAEEQAARSAVAIVERDRMLAQWLDRASSGFDRTRADLVRDHGLSEEQEAELEQVFARRKSELADLFTEMVSEEEKDDKAIFTGIGGLIRNKGLREDLAGILSDQQLEAFDARSDQRRRDTFEARAYRDMAEVHAVVQLTEAQQQDVVALFAAQAAERVEEEADARAFMSLVYGPVAAAMGSAMVRGMADMMNLDPAEQPNLEFGSDEHQQWIVEQQEKRIEIEISRLRDVLDEGQLARYREHLEAEPPR